LIDQVEFCDVLIINKIDLISEEELAKLEKVLSALQPIAKIIKTTNSEVDLKEVLNTQRFDFEKASESAGWIKEL
ncbi:GTP-binding protein, partial [Vibrio cholerae O1]|nr:GTP-binding protein [Vibrio cholerae O1]